MLRPPCLRASVSPPVAHRERGLWGSKSCLCRSLEAAEPWAPLPAGCPPPPRRCQACPAPPRPWRAESGRWGFRVAAGRAQGCHPGRRAGQGEPGGQDRATRAVPQDAADNRAMPTAGGSPTARRARWFVQRRARELRLKKAPLRSERLARTVPYCGAVTLPFTLLLLSNTLLFHFLLSPIHSPGFSLPSRPCCFRFFCLKFLRGRFYFQRFD